MNRQGAGRPAVFLDRDGVLNAAIVRNGVPTPPRCASEFQLLPGVKEACAVLRRRGYVLVVVTNQPDISRGLTNWATVNEMNRRLCAEVDVHDVSVCPHDDGDHCPCRKPRPGLILGAAQRLSLDLERSVCVGDRWRDREAARRAGIPAIHVDNKYREKPPDQPDSVVSSLLQAVPDVLRLTTARVRCPSAVST